MSNSTLATVKQMNHSNYTKISGRKIDKIILHHWGGIMKTAQDGLNYLSSKECKKRQVSAHYVIGNDGSIGQSVDEAYRAWTSGSLTADKNSVTIEVSNADSACKTISDKAMASLIKLVADIAKRNNLGTLTKGRNVYGHKDFASTACPCYYDKIADICTKANAINTPAKTTTTTTTKSGTYQVVTGSFSSKANAEAYVKKLKEKGFDSFIQFKEK